MVEFTLRWLLKLFGACLLQGLGGKLVTGQRAVCKDLSLTSVAWGIKNVLDFVEQGLVLSLHLLVVS